MTLAAVAEAQLPAPALSVELVRDYFRRLSPRTVRCYRSDLRDLASWLMDSGDVSEGAIAGALGRLVDLGPAGCFKALSDWQVDLEDRGLANATICRKMAAVGSVGAFLGRCGVINWRMKGEARILARKPPKKKPRKGRTVIGPARRIWNDLVGSLERRARKGDVMALRTRAMVRLMHDLGLRRGEVVGLEVDDVHHGITRGEGLWVLGKGRREPELMTLPLVTWQALEAWLAVRGRWLETKRGPTSGGPQSVFCISENRIYRLLIREGELLGLPARDRVTPHGLRHLAITTALEETRGDVRAVQRFSRHRDIRVIISYDDARRDIAGDVARMVSESKHDENLQ